MLASFINTAASGRDGFVAVVLVTTIFGFGCGRDNPSVPAVEDAVGSFAESPPAASTVESVSGPSPRADARPSFGSEVSPVDFPDRSVRSADEIYDRRADASSPAVAASVPAGERPPSDATPPTEAGPAATDDAPEVDPDLLAGSAATAPHYPTGRVRVLLREDFDRGHDVGHAPAWPMNSEPSEKERTAATHAEIVGGADNRAGDGLGLRVRDGDGGFVRHAFDFTENESFQLSALRFSFDFAYVDGLPAGGEVFIAAAEHEGTLNGRSRQYASAALRADGTFSPDPDRRRRGVDVSDRRSHRLDIYINDYERPFSCDGPDGRGMTIGPNAVRYYLDGRFVESRPLLASKTKGSTRNFGRVGFRTGGDEFGVCYVFDNVEVADLDAVPVPTERDVSRLAYEEDGRLTYGPYANEGDDRLLNRLPDFSHCGYRGGGVAIPFVSAVVTLEPGRGDDRRAIQRALDRVGGRLVGEDGFRGAVLLKAGTYRVGGTLKIEKSGVVLRGEGSQQDGGTKLVFSSDNQIPCIAVGGDGKVREVDGGKSRITDRYVPVGSKTLTVRDGSRFRAGDRVQVFNRYNDAWIDLIDMRQFGWNTKYYATVNSPRRVAAVDGDVLTLHAPLVNPIDARLGGGEVVKYKHVGLVCDVGVEALRIEAEYSYPLSDDLPWWAVSLRHTEDFWIRQVTAANVGKSCVNIERACRRGTVEDCAMLDYKGVIRGGGRYGFLIDDACFVLFQRCLTRNGRHDFISRSKVPGPNAFVDCRADMASSDIGPHSRWAMGFLYDNVKGPRIQVPNRHATGSGHGWAGAQQMLWNCFSTVMMCDAPKGAMNWSVGCVTAKIEGKVAAEPFGIWESHNVPVSPRSLYYAQLRDRLGPAAVRRVAASAQLAGPVWDALYDWEGEGVFGDAVTAWVGPGDVPRSKRLSVRISDLRLLDSGAEVVWEKVSGPGRVRFEPTESFARTARFADAGRYTLRATVADESGREATADVEVVID